MRNIRVLMSAIVLMMTGALIPSTTYAQDSGGSLTPQQQEAKNLIRAAAEAADKAAVRGPIKINLIEQATLDLPANYYFVPQKEATAFMDAVGHHTDSIVGMIGTPVENQHWFIIVDFIKSGYVKDDDAKNWDADELLKKLKEGTLDGNKNRTERGLPTIRVAGWVEPPAYDALTHRLVWSALVERIGDQGRDPSVNYNTYALGREGFFELNLVTPNSSIAQDKAHAQEMLAALHYNDGKRYQDFSAETDRVAEFGLAALIAGAAAKKLGLLALVAIFLVKIWKLLVIVSLVFMGRFKRFFKKRTSSNPK